MAQVEQEFAGRLAFVTGGARGIGLAISHRLAERGADLMQQGADRLSPYLKSMLPMMAENPPASSSSDDETEFSLDEEVW